MSKQPAMMWMFSLVVVRKGRRFLLVHERKHGQRWYLPAGRVEPGETFFEAAHREVMEEAGIPIVLDGILRIQHTPGLGRSGRMRVIFVAHPRDDTPPKSVPDGESLEARWVTLDELGALPLRGDEVRSVLAEVDSGGALIIPVSVLTAER